MKQVTQEAFLPSGKDDDKEGDRPVDGEREALIEHILLLDRRFDRNLQMAWGNEWAEVALTMPQLKTLFLVGAREGVNMTQLARTLGMTLSTLTGVVDRLADQGLVRRENDVHDRRVVLLCPTAEGMALMERLVRSTRERLRLILDGLSVANLRKVDEVLDLLYQAAEDAATRAAETEPV